MKRRQYKKLAFPMILASAALLLNACSKNLLNTVPDTSISNITAFDTKDRIEAQVNGLYASAKNTWLYGGRFQIYNELRSDEFIMGNADPGQSSNVWQQTINSGSNEVISTWSAGFSLINNVNTFIAGMETHKDVVGDDLYTQYIAEAKFLRAISYFALVQVYANPYTLDNGASPGLPLRLNAESSSEHNDLARSTVAQIYDQVLSDLDDAETGLPLDKGDDFTNVTTATRAAAVAFKTRVYLNKGDYPKVITEAAKIVSLTTISSSLGVPHSLEPDILNVFSGSYIGPEAIFSLPFTSSDAGSQLSYYFIAPPAPGSGYYLNDMGIISDPAFQTADDARSQLIVTSNGLHWLGKFTTPSPLTDYAPVIRYAEVLLNYAEAAARTNDLATAATLLNAVRHRSDPGYTFSNGDLSSATALQDLIIRERRIELLGEGFRTMDVQRQLLPIPGKTAAAATAPPIAVKGNLYIWPISSEELSVNKLMTPNE